MNVSNSLSGFTSAVRQLGASAHNVANLQTEDVTTLRARQLHTQPGCSRVEVSRTAKPEDVSIAREALKSSRAQVQARASLRVIETESEMVGSLLDIRS